MPNDFGYASTNGINTYYEVHGTGPALVLVEGLGVATWLWEKQVEAFARHFTTIIYDLRGSGNSDKPTEDYSVSLFAQDLEALLSELNVEKAHVLGVSLGGFIAQHYAANYPDRVDKLVLVSTAPGGEHQIPMSEEVVEQLLVATKGDQQLIREKMGLAFSNDFRATEEFEDLLTHRSKTKQPSASFLSQAKAGSAFDGWHDLKNIQAPTLIVAASGDLVVSSGNSILLNNQIVNSELVIYPGLGHQFFVEAPEPFNRDVIKFLSTG